MNYALNKNPDEIVIHQVMGRDYAGTAANPRLSLKCMFGGSARYVTDSRKEHCVDDSCFLILNQGHGYTFEKNPATVVETFCIFFPENMAASVSYDIETAPEKLLESPESEGRPAFNFYEHCRPHGDAISLRIARLRSEMMNRQLDDAFLDQEIRLLLASMVADHALIRKRVSELPWSRPTTRAELFRRIHQARDYMHANLSNPFSLNETAKFAALSPYHFLRSFKIVTGETPLAYSQRIRIERAKWLLCRTRLPVSEIAHKVGYESPASFSTLFRKHSQVSPSEYRCIAN